MFDPRIPFSSRQALAAGISRRRLRGEEFQQLFRGCYVAADVVPTTHVRARAAIEVLGAGQFASHQSAATLHNGVVPASSDLHLGTTEDKRVRRDGIHGHRYDQVPRLVWRDGLAITTPAQTFVDLAAELDLVDQVILGDSLVQRRRISPRELVQAAAAVQVPGAPRARQAAGLVRARAESPRETRLRLLMGFAGLPEPAVNLVVIDPRTQRERRIDLAYEEAKLAIEFDGRHHYTGGERQWRADIARREELERLGWRFIVLVSADLFVEPGRVLERVVDGMRLQGMAPVRLDPQWRRFFPGSRAAV